MTKYLTSLLLFIGLSFTQDITIAVLEFEGKGVSYDGELNLTSVFVEDDSTGIEVFINEILARNDTTNTDESGEYDDWLELYNTGTESEDIGGFYLTDNADNLTKWIIPDGTVIQSQNFLLFWCDEDQEQGDLHTNFKLSAGGEFLALVNIDGVTILDSITFGNQSTDISYGRVFDGSSEWNFLSPTPGSTNSSSGMEVSESTLPETFTLYQNYPNPFNPTTILRYDLPKDALVNITIYDMMGRVVSNLVSSRQSAGYKSIQWNATNNAGQSVSAGVYLYTIEAGEFVRTRKMVLLK